MSYIRIGPIGYEQTIAVHQAQQVILDSKARSFPVLLERTDEPVWQEDESRENQMRADRGEEPTPFLDEEDANAALRLITVALPDRLQAAIPKPDSEMASTETSHVGLQIPTSFSAPDSLVLRRIRLDLTLSAKAGLMPVVVQMRPDPAIDRNARLGGAGYRYRQGHISCYSPVGRHFHRQHQRQVEPGCGTPLGSKDRPAAP